MDEARKVGTLWREKKRKGKERERKRKKEREREREREKERERERKEHARDSRGTFVPLCIIIPRRSRVREKRFRPIGFPASA
jgi:hypothetical protein